MNYILSYLHILNVKRNLFYTKKLYRYTHWLLAAARSVTSQQQASKWHKKCHYIMWIIEQVQTLPYDCSVTGKCSSGRFFWAPGNILMFSTHVKQYKLSNCKICLSSNEGWKYCYTATQRQYSKESMGFYCNNTKRQIWAAILYIQSFQLWRLKILKKLKSDWLLWGTVHYYALKLSLKSINKYGIGNPEPQTNRYVTVLM